MMKLNEILLSIFLLFVTFQSTFGTRNEDILVRIKQGQLKGKIVNDYFGAPYYSFEGIPYAKPPLNELRFKAPQPAESWTGILDATKRSNVCMQRDFVENEVVTGVEDCLYVNVYTHEFPQNTSVRKLKPVMFWVHGGALQLGAPYYTEPGFLMSEDIVFVSITYRLNIFGFLSFEDSELEVPGNAGLKDQVLALKWVKENIENFGGDPNCVTIFGVSAGGASTHLLYLSPMTKGLFHRVIAQSGSAMNPWVGAPRRYQLLADRIECGTSDPQKILDCFRKKNATELLLACKDLDVLHTGDLYPEFGVVVETPSKEEAFLPKPVDKIIAKGEFNHVPFITGYAKHDGDIALMLPNLPVTPSFTDVQLLVPNDTNVMLGTEKATFLGNKIKQFFFGTETPGNNTIWEFFDYNTDVFFLEKMYRHTKAQVAVSKAPIYFYQFNYFTTLNDQQNYSKPVVSHGDDQFYLFVMSTTPSSIKKESDEAIGIYRMVKLWTTFAKTGNPNSETDDPLLEVTWRPVTKDKFNYLEISPDLVLRTNPEKKRMKFWEDFYAQL